MNIHSTALIDPSAKLGTDIDVGPGAVIEAGVELGDGCVVGPTAVIRSHANLGPGCRVHAGAVIGDTPQDLSFKNVASYVRIGARCVFREGVTVHRGTKENSDTVIGDDCFLMANSHVAHNCRLGNKVILANGVLLGGYVDIDNNAFISGNAVIHQFCRVGRLAMVGGLSGISKDVPPFCMTRSVSLNTVVGLNVVGLRRNGYDTGQRRAVRQCFSLLYREGFNVSQAVVRMKELVNGPAVDEFMTFLETSKRGICKFSVREGDVREGDSDEE